MAGEFNDINSPGYSCKKKEEPKGKRRNTGVDDSEPAEKKKEDPKVRIISAEWKPGPKGYQYLEQCFLDVQTEFLPGKEKTVRLRIRGKLFGIYNGQEFDLSQEVEGFIDRKTGIARLEIKKLWFIDDHYPEWKKDSQTPCTYKIKGIFHSRGENEIDSPELKMPAPRPLLKKGHFDDVAVSKYSSRTADGEGYITGEWVKYLQQSLTDFGFDEVGTVDGDFGQKTHDAVLLFQDCARNQPRLHENIIQEVEPTLNGEPDGIVGDNTWKEIDLWAKEEYFRPTADLSITLAVDPSDADVQDDEYLLIRATDTSEIADTDIIGYRTVQDDAIAGDQQLTLDFYGLTPGDSYELVLRRGGEDYTVVDPFVWKKRDKNKYAPASVTLKAAVRELELYRHIVLGSQEEIRNERLSLLKNRWVYVFAQKAEEGGSAWLDAEYWFDDTGKAHPVNLRTQKTADTRQAHANGRDTINIPARLNGDSLRGFIGASPFQLNWQRIQELCKDPSIRCYEIGTTSTLGTVWIPQRLEQHKELLKITNSADSNLEGIEQDTLLVGVRDLLSQACERNTNYRKALDHFLEVRFDTTIKDDGKGNISLENSEQQSRSQLEQMTAGLVIHALTGGRDGAPMDEGLMRKCLRNDGADFKGWLSQKMHAHTQAYVEVHGNVQKIASYLEDPGWGGVEADIAAMVHNREGFITAFDYLFGAITRLDEIDAGRDLLVKHVKGKHPVLNQDTGLLATGKAVHKNVESYVKVVTSLAKVYASSPRIGMAVKKAQVARLFEKGFDARINQITETISRQQYLDDFDAASAGGNIEFTRFDIDENSVAHLKNLDDFDAVMDRCGAVLDGLSVVMAGYEFQKGTATSKDGIDVAKSISSVLIYIGKLKRYSGTTIGAIAKRASPVHTIVFSIAEAGFSGYDSFQEFATNDVDAAVAKSVSTAGHLLTAAGTVMIFFPPTAAFGIGIVAVGTILGAGGGIWHGFVDDNEITIFLKQSPWGIGSEAAISISGIQKNNSAYLSHLEKGAKPNG